MACRQPQTPKGAKCPRRVVHLSGNQVALSELSKTVELNTETCLNLFRCSEEKSTLCLQRLEVYFITNEQCDYNVLIGAVVSQSDSP